MDETIIPAATALRQMRGLTDGAPSTDQDWRLDCSPNGVCCGVRVRGIWLLSNRQSFDWQAAATVATWLMTLFIQRAEHRDTQAIHAKLDELLRVEGRARKELTQLDDEEPEVIEQHRSKERSGLEPGR